MLYYSTNGTFKIYLTHFIAMVWNQTHIISEICLGIPLGYPKGSPCPLPLFSIIIVQLTASGLLV